MRQSYIWKWLWNRELLQVFRELHERRTAPFHFSTFEHFPGSVRTSRRMFYYSDQTSARLISRHGFCFPFEFGVLSFWIFINRDVCEQQLVRFPGCVRKIFFWDGG